MRSWDKTHTNMFAQHLTKLRGSAWCQCLNHIKCREHVGTFDCQNRPSRCTDILRSKFGMSLRLDHQICDTKKSPNAVLAGYIPDIPAECWIWKTQPHLTMGPWGHSIHQQIGHYAKHILHSRYFEKWQIQVTPPNSFGWCNVCVYHVCWFRNPSKPMLFKMSTDNIKFYCCWLKHNA